MLNYIWTFMIVISLICGIITNNIQNINSAMFNGCNEAIKLSFSLLGIMAFWTGIMNIADSSGIINKISYIFKYPMKILFPKINNKTTAYKSIIMNISSNILGISNAATPYGLKAVKELKEHSNNHTEEIGLFVLINTSSIQLIPTTILMLRQTFNSVSPYEIILPMWFCSVASLIVGIISYKYIFK